VCLVNRIEFKQITAQDFYRVDFGITTENRAKAFVRWCYLPTLIWTQTMLDQFTYLDPGNTEVMCQTKWKIMLSSTNQR
jgi:hypothetical protein